MEGNNVQTLVARLGIDVDSAMALLAAADGDLSTAMAVAVGYNDFGAASSAEDIQGLAMVSQEAIEEQRRQQQEVEREERGRGAVAAADASVAADAEKEEGGELSLIGPSPSDLAMRCQLHIG